MGHLMAKMCVKIYLRWGLKPFWSDRNQLELQLSGELDVVLTESYRILVRFAPSLPTTPSFWRPTSLLGADTRDVVSSSLIAKKKDDHCCAVGTIWLLFFLSGATGPPKHKLAKPLNEFFFAWSLWPSAWWSLRVRRVISHIFSGSYVDFVIGAVCIKPRCLERLQTLNRTPPTLIASNALNYEICQILPFCTQTWQWKTHDLPFMFPLNHH